jgi:hypothetical protein
MFDDDDDEEEEATATDMHVDHFVPTMQQAAT